ncbi:hypothetical protein D6817_00305 [Candidatus Pacearchaeota archaeon]|nr:MAG: hypothetical protein D6817_00305 [Candidatus Pacearchaeota archaeon]
MEIVKFSFDEDKDLFNIWETANFHSPWADFTKQLPAKVISIAKGKKFGEVKESLKKMHRLYYSSFLLSLTLKFVKEAWKNIEAEYFRRLREITGKKFEFAKVTAYLTFAPRCPYNPNRPDPWLMFSFQQPLHKILKTIGHELLHIHFHNTYYNTIKAHIGKEKTENLKEALTVLLNMEFRDLWISKDHGYKPHQNLRRFILQRWESEKDFNKLINACVSRLNNEKARKRSV